MRPKCDYLDCKWFDDKSSFLYKREGTPVYVYWPANCVQCGHLNRTPINYEKKEEEDA